MKTLIRNIGALVSGDIRRPILEGDSLLIRDGKIARVGDGLDDDADTVIDAKGTTVMPGLIDSHVHPVFGDFTPRQRTVDFIDSMMNGGVTTAISAGEVHLPGARGMSWGSRRSRSSRRRRMRTSGLAA